MILAGAAALAVDRVADLRLRAASSIHPGSVAPGARWRPACPCSSTLLQILLRHRVVRRRAGSQAAPSRTAPRRCPCARRKAPRSADKSSATPAPTSGARNSHAAGSGERSRVTTQRKHVRILRLPVPVGIAPAGARMAPANALPVRRLVHGAAELRRRDKLLHNKQRMARPPIRRRTIRDNANEARKHSATTRNNKPRVVPGNRLNRSSRRQPIQRSRGRGCPSASPQRQSTARAR